MVKVQWGSLKFSLFFFSFFRPASINFFFKKKNRIFMSLHSIYLMKFS
jgi:hypothetical protein